METNTDLADDFENKHDQSHSSTDENKSLGIKKGHIFKRRKCGDFRSEKDKYINMPKEEKRKFYSRKKQVELESIATWEQHYEDNKEQLDKLADIIEQNAEVNAGLNKKVSIWKGDLTLLEIDAITNAAKETLLGGAGVDGAIHYAAGEDLLQECKSLGGCDTGDAKITGGYKLPAKYVIHTVGPRGENPGMLKSCYLRTLSVLKENELRTVAFPCISTGIYGYKNEKAAPVAVSAVRDWLEHENNAESVERIIFCVYLSQDVDLYQEVMTQYFPVKDRKEITDIKCLPSHASIKSDRSFTSTDDVVGSPMNKPRKRKNSSHCTLI